MAKSYVQSVWFRWKRNRGGLEASQKTDIINKHDYLPFAHIYVHTHMFTHTRTHTCTHMHTHTYTHAHTHTHTHVHTCTHAHTHTHTHTHTYTGTHAQMGPLKWLPHSGATTQYWETPTKPCRSEREIPTNPNQPQGNPHKSQPTNGNCSLMSITHR